MDAIATPTTLGAVVARLVLATVLGAAVGLNREWLGKPAGLRTHALVALGASVFTIVGLLLSEGDGATASRVIQGVTAGIGFIGAGVIMHRPETNDVHGLTTAAAIWMVAAVGVAVGAGLWRTSLVAALVTLVVLVLGEAVDRWLHLNLPSGRR